MHNGPTLMVDLAALCANYRVLRDQLAGGRCAAVVKSNAYGLGMAPVARALAQEECRNFFVATLEEGIALRAALPDAAIYIFHGVGHGEANEFLRHGLIPVLNDEAQFARWREAGSDAKAVVHIDTGMTRLGVSLSQLARMKERGLLPRGICLLMSHLACAHDPRDPKNQEQLERFRQARALLPEIPASLANSSGIFLGMEYHFALARPGAALYGVNPTPGRVNPMRHVATLSAPILQLRHLEKEETVGYGATFTARKGSVLATLALGYADGYPRILSSKGMGFLDGYAVPIIGRVSMDMIVADVTAVPESVRGTSTRVMLLCEQQKVDAFARACATIGYEVLTRIGPRVRRVYEE